MRFLVLELPTKSIRGFASYDKYFKLQIQLCVPLGTALLVFLLLIIEDMGSISQSGLLKKLLLQGKFLSLFSFFVETPFAGLSPI